MSINRLSRLALNPPRRFPQAVILPALLSLCLFNSPAFAENATVPGEVSTPYPTITNLAVEWLITGDDNTNARVETAYRMAGQTEWKPAQDLFRVPAYNTGESTWPTYRWPNKFSGSVFDLKPGTKYEIRLRLSDPDGGKAEKVVTVGTRPVPRPAEDAVVKKVNAVTFLDSMLKARPGDILLLAPGYYKETAILKDGAPGRPIVYRADGTLPAMGSTFEKLSLEGRKHIIIEGLTVKGSMDLRSAEDVAVRYCTVKARYGIIAQYQPGCKNCYIADNTVTYDMPWVAVRRGPSTGIEGAPNVGEGIELTGPGNVICFNKVTGYRDCISTMEDLWVYDQICVDIYNNELALGADDAIEADFCSHNCRILRNRITDCGMGLSSQPGLGGPVYFIRNAMYNIAAQPYKLERISVGNVFLHNTCFKSGPGFAEAHSQNTYFRAVFKNNLSIGGPRSRQSGGPATRGGNAVLLPGFNSTCVFDYNAVGVTEGPFEGLIGVRGAFTDLAGMLKLSGGKHSIQIDMKSLKTPPEFPGDVYGKIREVADLRLAGDSPAVDAAEYLPNVNDGFSGKAPDIGAYELGQDLPHYGPRPAGVDEETMWRDSPGR